MIREELETRGFVRVPAALSPPDLEAVRQAMEGLDLVAGPSGYGRIVHDPWRHRSALRQRLLAGVLPALAEQAVGARVMLFQDHLVSKTPGTLAPVKWHQDYSYWPLSEPRGVTMWVALDPADEENGCLHYVPGSHRLGERQPADFIAGAAQGSRAELLPIGDVTGAVPVPVLAGDVLLHHPLVWHHSPGNGSDRSRRAWSISWVTDEVRWAPDHAPHPYNWSLSPEPGKPLDPGHFPRPKQA